MSLYTATKEVVRKNGKSIYQIECDLNLLNELISKWNKNIPGANYLQDVTDYLGTTTQYLFYLSRKDK